MVCKVNVSLLLGELPQGNRNGEERRKGNTFGCLIGARAVSRIDYHGSRLLDTKDERMC